jgi:hypothetical protein
VGGVGEVTYARSNGSIIASSFIFMLGLLIRLPAP